MRLILNGEASKEIEWHCKVRPWLLAVVVAVRAPARPSLSPLPSHRLPAQHYVGRGLMKKFDTVEEVAKEMGLPVSKLQGTFDAYMEVCKDPKKDPFGKKFFSATNWGKNAGPFHVAIMSPVLH